MKSVAYSYQGISMLVNHSSDGDIKRGGSFCAFQSEYGNAGTGFLPPPSSSHIHHSYIKTQ